jgi:hypothetical protein
MSSDHEVGSAAMYRKAVRRLTKAVQEGVEYLDRQVHSPDLQQLQVPPGLRLQLGAELGSLLAVGREDARDVCAGDQAL